MLIKVNDVKSSNSGGGADDERTEIFNKSELFLTDITLIIHKLVVLNNYILKKFNILLWGVRHQKEKKSSFQQSVQSRGANCELTAGMSVQRMTLDVPSRRGGLNLCD